MFCEPQGLISFEKEVTIVYVFWLANQIFSVIVFLNVLIEIISQTYDETLDDCEMLYNKHKAICNA